MHSPEKTFQVIERGRTTGWIYGVTKPLSFHAAESFAFLLRQISKQGGHEVSCYFVTLSLAPESLLAGREGDL